MFTINLFILNPEERENCESFWRKNQRVHRSTNNGDSWTLKKLITDRTKQFVFIVSIAVVLSTSPLFFSSKLFFSSLTLLVNDVYFLSFKGDKSSIFILPSWTVFFIVKMKLILPTAKRNKHQRKRNSKEEKHIWKLAGSLAGWLAGWLTGQSRPQATSHHTHRTLSRRFIN